MSDRRPGYNVWALSPREILAPMVKIGEHEVPAGIATLIELAEGIAAVVDRLEYGATKHLDESWKWEDFDDHLAALGRHVMMLGTIRHDAARGLIEPSEARERCRKHTAAIACRALMALTVDAAEES